MEYPEGGLSEKPLPRRSIAMTRCRPAKIRGQAIPGPAVGRDTVKAENGFPLITPKGQLNFDPVSSDYFHNGSEHGTISFFNADTKIAEKMIVELNAQIGFSNVIISGKV